MADRSLVAGVRTTRTGTAGLGLTGSFLGLNQVVWAAESLLVVTIPLVAAQIASAVVKWVGRIMGYTGALVPSLIKLRVLLEG